MKIFDVVGTFKSKIYYVSHDLIFIYFSELFIYNINMNVKNELVIGIIGSVFIIFLTVFFAGQYKNQQDQFKKNSQSKTASQLNGLSQNIGTSLTFGEVLKHGSEVDCWLIINNLVYDVSQYLILHPGGKDRIISYCGQDATSAYSTQGGKGSHSAIASGELEKLKIGQLNETINAAETSIRIQNNIKSINSSGRNESEEEDND